MTDPENVVAGGVSEEIWGELEKDWGTTAREFRGLKFFRNYQGGYKHCDRIPDHVKCERNYALFDNDKINILEIRYGAIPGENSGQPCIWFLLKHEKDFGGQISTRAHLRIWLEVFEHKDETETWVSIAEDSPDDMVNKATQHGTDTYALAVKILTPKEWSDNETLLSGESASGNPFLLQIYNSHPQVKYTPGGIWLVEGMPV